MLWNQVLPALGPSTPLKDLNWSAGGRQAVVALKESVANRGAAYQSEKVLMVLRGVFSYAIDRAWMETPNPALKTATIDSGHKSKQNPALKWEQVPQLFEDLDSKSGELVLQLALKVLAMTFLRVGSLVPARWEELDYESFSTTSRPGENWSTAWKQTKMIHLFQGAATEHPRNPAGTLQSSWPSSRMWFGRCAFYRPQSTCGRAQRPNGG